MKHCELSFAAIAQVAPLIAKTKVSPVELVRWTLKRIEQLDGAGRLNAFLSVTAEQALAQARRTEREIFRGRHHGPLHGIPLSLKDNIWTQGIRTTAGSKILADFLPGEDATLVHRLRRAGAILLGKTNLHEFAYGVTTENPHFGPTRNPWASGHIAGGSSGGSAAAVAAGLCFGSVGSDTGGSIRIPAALCGIVGLKPSFGRVSCFGVVPLAPSLDHVGPLARGVMDAAILLATIAGRDPRDPATSAQPALGLPRHCLPRLRASLRCVRLGWPREYFWENVDGEIKRIIETAARSLEQAGAAIEEISLPHIGESVEPNTNIALAEATHFHQTAGYFPARAADYGADVRQRLEMGTQVRAVDYLAACEARKTVRADFEAALEHVDAILAPTVPIAAPPIGAKRVRIGSEEESVRSALLRLNRSANFTGLPAISVPCGFTRAGLPVGLQLIGRMWEEARLLSIAFAYEQATDWHQQHPAM